MTSSPLLTPLQLSQWKQKGFLKLSRFFDRDVHAAIQEWVQEIEGWNPLEGEWLQYFEQIGEEVKISRSENFVPFHSGMKALLSTGKLLQVITEALGEPAVLYKEKNQL